MPRAFFCIILYYAMFFPLKMYRISSQFIEFYKLDPNTYKNDIRWSQLRKWLNDTNQQHSTCWLEGQQINNAILVKFDKFLEEKQI